MILNGISSRYTILHTVFSPRKFVIPIKRNGKVDYSSKTCFESLQRYEFSSKELGKSKNNQKQSCCLRQYPVVLMGQLIDELF